MATPRRSRMVPVLSFQLQETRQCRLLGSCFGSPQVPHSEATSYWLFAIYLQTQSAKDLPNASKCPLKAATEDSEKHWIHSRCMTQKDSDVQYQCSLYKPSQNQLELCQHLLVAFVFLLVTCHLGSTALFVNPMNPKSESHGYTALNRY